MVFKNGVKNIQAETYKSKHMVCVLVIHLSRGEMSFAYDFHSPVLNSLDIFFFSLSLSLNFILLNMRLNNGVFFCLLYIFLPKWRLWKQHTRVKAQRPPAFTSRATRIFLHQIGSQFPLASCGGGISIFQQPATRSLTGTKPFWVPNTIPAYAIFHNFTHRWEN